MIIFNEAKPKYDKLDELFDEYINNIKFSNQINIIVDVKEVSRKFFRPDTMKTDSRHRLLIEEISSDIINIISHYRNYFNKKGKYTNFYFLYSFKECTKMKEKFSDYKKEYYEKYFNDSDERSDIIKRAIEVVQKVVSVVPHAYFIETSNYDEFVYTKYIVENILNKNNELNLLLSNDDIFYQLINNHTILLNLKGIRSFLATEKNAVSILTKKENINLSPNSIPLILSLSGDKKYSFKSIPSVAIVKATQIVEKLVEEGKAQDVNSIEIPLDFTKLNSNNKNDKKIILNTDLIRENYKLIRADEMLYAHKSEIENKFIGYKKKTGSIKYFQELNAKIFNTYPLMLDMLLKGERY